jgi:GAF domain-containing protein
MVLGSLCVIDTKPREFSEEERRRLQEMADELMAQIEGEHRERLEKKQADPVSGAN